MLGAHKHRGSSNPFRTRIEDFQDWTDSNNLVHFLTRGLQFTWNNGKRGVKHIERILNKVIYYQSQINFYSNSSCYTLIRYKSDYHPILLVLNYQTLKVTSNFKFQKMWFELLKCINIGKACWNTKFFECFMFVLSQKLKLLKSK